MKVELKIDDNIQETKVVVYAKEETQEVSNLISKIKECDDTTKIIGYEDGRTFILKKDEIESIFTEMTKVYARINNEKYQIKMKIYELEELLNGTSFVRISNSEIANFNKVESMEIRGSTLIVLKYKSGQITYVSRRNIKKIKKYLNI